MDSQTDLRFLAECIFYKVPFLTYYGSDVSFLKEHNIHILVYLNLTANGLLKLGVGIYDLKFNIFYLGKKLTWQLKHVVYSIANGMREIWKTITGFLINE